MNIVSAFFVLLIAVGLAGCDLRSDTAKREMEKFSGTPTPTLSPAPTEVPVAPSEIVNVDTSTPVTTISVSGGNKKQSLTCKTFERVTINGDRSVVTVKGPCRQIVINGNNNQISADAFLDITINGSDNSVTYSRYINGKRPIITDNANGNTIEKASAAETTDTSSKEKTAK